jgi:hypothetical protein
VANHIFPSILLMRNLFLSMAACVLLADPAAWAGSIGTPVDYFTNAYVCCDLTAAGGSGNYNPNVNYSTNSVSGFTTDGNVYEALASTADLANGALHVSNYGGSSAPDSVNTNAQAVFGDTFTATGQLGGNLGVNLSIDGSNFSQDAGGDLAYLVVEAVPAGTFGNGSPYANAGWAGYYLLGNDTNQTPDAPGSPFAGLLGTYGLTESDYQGFIGDGTDALTLGIPFTSLGSNFQLVFALAAYQESSVSAGDEWDIDYGDTVGITLTPPSGTTLTSDGGLPITAAPTPEPSTLVLLGAGLLAITVCRAWLMAQGVGPVSMYNVAKSTEPERADPWMSRLTAQATSHNCCGDGAPGIPPFPGICSS